VRGNRVVVRVIEGDPDIADLAAAAADDGDGVRRA